MVTPDWRQIERENDGLSVRSASLLGEGWCSHAYLVNDELVFRLFGTYRDASENFSFEPVVLHADLSGDHLLMDSRLVTGVLDFGDVNWGDRDYDFHYLFLDFGAAFAMDVARRYGHPSLDQLPSKLRYFALADQLGTILEGPGRPLDGQIEAAWIRVKELLRDRDVDRPIT